MNIMLKVFMAIDVIRQGVTMLERPFNGSLSSPSIHVSNGQIQVHCFEKELFREVPGAPTVEIGSGDYPARLSKVHENVEYFLYLSAADFKTYFSPERQGDIAVHIAQDYQSERGAA